VSPRGADLLTALGLASLLAAVSLTAPRWSRFFQQPLPVSSDDPAAPPPTQEAPPAEARRTINVKLFFDAPDMPGLALEERAVPFSNDLATQVRTLVEELVKGSQIGLLPTLPPSTKVLEVFVTARGVAYVDLSKEAQNAATGGSDAELRSVYSVVNSVAMSLPSVSRVQILIENQPVATLSGHVDLSRPLPPDMTLLAAAALAPAASPPAAAPSPEPSQPPAARPPS
jgi:spore germination protein GerM